MESNLSSLFDIRSEQEMCERRIFFHDAHFFIDFLSNYKEKR